MIVATQSSTAPPVVVVLVAHDPEEWFDEVLDGLASQDYPQLAVLCVDTGETDVTEKVKSKLPSAAVMRDSSGSGYGAAANLVRGAVEGAAFYFFIHDDVALEPSTIRQLVEESFRSNAAVAGPKLMDWSRDRHIRSVGNTIDGVGTMSPYAEPDELDQEQHDRVRDVFVVSGGAILIRSDLFETIGGFDRNISFLGDDLDLCWRAQLAGARVIVVPDASARHLEAFTARRGIDDRRKLLARHRLRTVLKCYGWVHLLCVLPFAFALSVAEVLYSLLFGRFAQARDITSAWVWNGARLPAIVAHRRSIRKFRRVRDSELGRLHVRGSARLNSFLRGQIGGDTRLQNLASRGKDFSGTFRSGPRRSATLGWSAVALVWMFGTRHLLTRGVPVYGQFASFPDAGSMLHAWWSGWRDAGLGDAGAGPAAMGLLGGAGTMFLGATGLLRQVLILGLMPLGFVGVWRLVGPLGSRRGRLVAVMLYAALPLPYNALAGGRWDTLLLYGTLPFVVLRVNRLIGLPPFGTSGGDAGPGIPRRTLRHQAVTLGLLMAVIAAFEPLIVVLVPMIAVVLVIVSILSGNAVLPLRAVLLSLVSAGIAAVLHLPWLLQFTSLDDFITQLVGRPSAPAPLELHRLLRFESGPWGGHGFGWAPLIVAAVPLVIARDQRMVGAVRAWGMCIAGFGGAWVTANGWTEGLFSQELPVAEMLLVLAAVGVAWAAASGFAAFENDVPRFGFGWRQMAIGIGVVALAGSIGPSVLGTADGRWRTPTNDLVASLRLIDDRDAGPSYRVLWIGAAEVMPLDGWEVVDGVLAGSSVRGFPDVRQQWAGPYDGSQQRLVQTVRLGLEGETARLGRLLAPMGVRYVVVVQRATPSFSDGLERPASASLLAAMSSQLDMRPVATDPSVLVFENDAWMSSRAQFETALPDVSQLDEPAELVVTDLTAGIPVLTDRRSSTEHWGQMSDDPVLVAENFDEGWTLTVEGQTVEPSQAFGWAMSFDPPAGGLATLSFARPRSVTFLLVLQTAMWLLAARIAIAEQGRRGFLRRRQVNADSVEIVEAPE
ncbi:MAG: GT2 family glycosyltransferase [Candidatus Poriferisodalaceae bacterium]|jgi:GT2 family glycosyltransferase